MDLPVLQIVKETEAVLPQAGDILTYTLTYSNVGVAPAYLATITDSLPVEVDYLSSYPTGTYEANTHTVSWMVEILTDSVATISLVVALDEATPISTVVTNTVDLIWEGILISDTASFTTAGAPIADFSFAIDGLRVTFTNTTQTGYPPETVFEWDFGDGVTSTVENPVHLFDTVGSYTVTLEACNLIGCSIDSEQLATCLLPEAGFITSTLGLTAYFTNTSQSASGLLWDFGDGITSTLTDPEHIYIMPGTYTVQLHAQNECGVDVVTSTLTVDALADVTVSKDGDQSIVIVGSPLTYTIMVENLGPDAATGIMVVDVLPADMIYQSASPGCSQENGIVNCAVDDLSSGGQAVLVIKLLVPGVPGEITNIAYLTSSVNDPDLTNNQAVEYTLVIELPNTIYLPISIR
jgi:uncharacterized repeat protein (TIGR01451 family)